MTTTRQVKALVRPLLERHRDLVFLSPTFLCLVPVHHVARVIGIRRSSSADGFQVEWRLFEQFIPQVSWVRTLGWCDQPVWPTKGVGGHGFWQWSYPGMADDFIGQVETVALPLLRSLDTLEACATIIRNHRMAEFCMGPHWRLAVDAAFGDLDSARTNWEIVRPRHEAALSGPQRDRGPDRFLELGDALVANDRAAVARVLHLVEAEHIAGSPLEPYWQPTPFPLEA